VSPAGPGEREESAPGPYRLLGEAGGKVKRAAFRITG
jgi:hypothetical protein